MSDTWNDLVRLKNKQASRKEMLARRKKEREGILVGALKTEDSKPDTSIHTLLQLNLVITNVEPLAVMEIRTKIMGVFLSPNSEKLGVKT